MPTEPFKKLLDRDVQKVQAAPIIQLACPLLQEIVNYGTNVFGRCDISRHDAHVKEIPDEGHIVIFLLYRHILEMIDAMEVCLSNSVVDPTLTQLRSAFEAYLQLEWIMKDDTLHRVHAYLVYDIRDRIKIYMHLIHHLNMESKYKRKFVKINGRPPYPCQKWRTFPTR